MRASDEANERLDSQPGRHLAGAVPTQAVRHDIELQVVLDGPRVFVVLADGARIGNGLSQNHGLRAVCWNGIQGSRSAAVTTRLSIRRTPTNIGSAGRETADNLHESWPIAFRQRQASSHPSPSSSRPLPCGCLADLYETYAGRYLDRGRPRLELHGFHTPPREPTRSHRPG